MIKTRIRIHPDLFNNPEAFIRHHYLPIRSMKPSKGRSRNGPTWNLSLDVLTYKGIQVKLKQVAGDQLASATIHLNPGVCLYGHNGRIITLTEFLHALALLVTHLAPLLNHPDDWMNLIPGLMEGGLAYWSYLELQFQRHDPDGILLAGFRPSRHPSITTATRHWDTSILVGGERSKLKFAIYRKAIEMVAHGKLPESALPEYQDILRIEARMKGEKLVDYFGNARNTEVIGGKKRLVRFLPDELVQGHRKSFSKFLGVFSTHEVTEALGKKEQLRPLGRLLAQAALHPLTTQTFPELLAELEFYTKASSDTIWQVRDAGLAELSRLSTISKDDLFSDASYETQPGIAIDELESKIRHDFEDTVAHHLITSAYQPPDLPFLPLTELPSYCCG
jgi:hypothetical protein